MKTNKHSLLKCAEEVAYTSKGHFKTADFKKVSFKFYIIIPIITSVILLVFVDMSQTFERILSCFNMIFSILALCSPIVSNQDKTLKEIEEQMLIGTKYLEIYKDIRDLIFSDKVDENLIKVVSLKIRELDRDSSVYQISMPGRIWSAMRIKKEMDLDWIYEEEKSC